MDNEERIARLEEMLGECFKRINYLDNLLVNEIIDPISSAYEKREDEENFNVFKDKYGERLAPYSDMLTTIEAGDTDAVRKAYDTYKSYDDDVKSNFTEEQYIDMLCTELDKYINKIRDSLGVGKNSDVSVTSTSEGDVSVAVNGEEIGTAEKEPTPADEVPSEPSEEEVTETTEENSEVEEPTKELSEDEESKAFMEELMRDREKYMKGR